MKITIRASYCHVEGDKSELWWLWESLAFRVPGAEHSELCKTGKWDGKRRFYNYKEQTFPIGLLEYVLRFGKTKSITVIDTRRFPLINDSLMALDTVELRDYQINAVQACLDAKNCLVEAATNAGKTAIFSCLIKKLHPAPTLVLTHSKELLSQLVDFIEEYTGLECGFITAKDTLLKPVTVAMVKTLFNRRGVDQEIDIFFDSLKCVIHDEVHHAQGEQFTKVLADCPAVYRFGFSGTVPPERDYAGVLVRQFFGPVVLKISNEELIELEVSAKPKINLYEIDVRAKTKGMFQLAKEQLQAEDELYSGQQLVKRVYKLVVDKGIIENEERNSKSVDIINANPGKSVLIVVNYLRHGEIVEKMLLDNKINASFISGTAKHRTQALEDFKAGKLRVLISTCIVDEGLDISRIEVLIILAGLKSRRQLLQRVGRSLRRKEGENTVLIYDFMDMGNKHLLKHSKERLAIYKQEQFSVDFI